VIFLSLNVEHAYPNADLAITCTAASRHTPAHRGMKIMLGRLLSGSDRTVG